MYLLVIIDTVVNNSYYFSGIYSGPNTLTPTSKVGIIPLSIYRWKNWDSAKLVPWQIIQFVSNGGGIWIQICPITSPNYWVIWRKPPYHPQPLSQGLEPLPKHEETMARRDEMVPLTMWQRSKICKQFIGLQSTFKGGLECCGKQDAIFISEKPSIRVDMWGLVGMSSGVAQCSLEQ